MRTAARHALRGLSLVELLVGSAVGLLLVSGAIHLVSSQVDASRHLLLEARVEQDLRASAELLARELRRAGHWPHAVATLRSAAATNPHTAVATASTPALLFSYAREGAALDDDAVDTSERMGLRLSGGVLQWLVGGSWQALTDPGVVTVTQLAVAPRLRCISLSAHCPTPGLADACVAAGTGLPRLWQRSYEIEIAGRPTAIPGGERRVVETVMLRNDAFEHLNGCPA